MWNLTRSMALLGVLALAGAAGARADEASVSCFLVDSRVHVTVVSTVDGREGELVWRDTVTGESGGEPFTARGGRLLLEGATTSATAIARVLPDLAIVLEHPPWAREDSGPSLGIALN